MTDGQSVPAELLILQPPCQAMFYVNETIAIRCCLGDGHAEDQHEIRIRWTAPSPA